MSIDRSFGSTKDDSVLATSKLDHGRFVMLASIGALAGLVVPSLGALTQPLLVLVFLGIVVSLATAVIRRRFVYAWALMAFMCAIEPVFRLHASVLPYFAVEYVQLGSSVVIIVLQRPRKGASMQVALAYGIYLVLEVVGSVWADNFEEARSVVLPSVLMFVYMLSARRTRLSPVGVTFILASYITGAVTTMGFAVRAYLFGTIAWQTTSNSVASGGMPPNHVSVLMSVAVFACILLAEDASRFHRLVILGVATILGAFMVLTFSRGGTVILFLALIFYYVVLRSVSRRTVFTILAVAVAGLLISYGTHQLTGGIVADRYSEANTTNRLTIATQGWDIFKDNALIGVGTSNFHNEISEREFGRQTGAHNELIRAAAEHGAFGLVVWLWFLSTAFFYALRGVDTTRARRGLRVVLLIFATISMFYNGLKLAVQPMLVLLALSAFTADDAPPKLSNRARGRD
ncbi:MAG TPA: O-antigen ligase family protein [Kofleriaceae bacterium]|jgi:O-antigen ligase